jgi:hypothetical protein
MSGDFPKITIPYTINDEPYRLVVYGTETFGDSFHGKQSYE